MTWNVAVPGDTDKVRAGDDAIREMKTDIETALGVEHSFPINEATPVAYHKIPSGSTAARGSASSATSGRWYLNTDIVTNGGYIIQRDNGSTWDNLTETGPFDSGTVCFFCQSSAPTGWTRSSSVDDRLLRVSSSAGAGTGGTWDLSITAANFAHDHGGTTASGNMDGTNHTGTTTPAVSSGTAFAHYGDMVHSSSAHTHTINSDTFNHGHVISASGSWKPSYLDIIMCTKD